MIRIIITLLLVVLPSFCFGQKAKIAREVITAIESYAEAKVVKQTVKVGGKTVVKEATKYILKELTDKEAQALSLKLASSFSHIQVKPNLLNAAIKLCKSKGLSAPKNLEEVLWQLDSYAEKLYSDKSFLSSLGLKSLNSAEKLANAFVKNTYQLNSEVATELVGKIAEFGYKSSKVISFNVFNHIILRHCLGAPTKSKFLSSFAKSGKFFDEIEKTFSASNFVTTYNQNTKVYIKKFTEAIGKDPDGNDIYHLVVYVQDGKVKTAFPGIKSVVEQFYQKARLEAENAAIKASAAGTAIASVSDNYSSDSKKKKK